MQALARTALRPRAAHFTIAARPPGLTSLHCRCARVPSYQVPFATPDGPQATRFMLVAARYISKAGYAGVLLGATAATLAWIAGLTLVDISALPVSYTALDILLALAFGGAVGAVPHGFGAYRRFQPATTSALFGKRPTAARVVRLAPREGMPPFRSVPSTRPTRIEVPLSSMIRSPCGEPVTCGVAPKSASS